MKQAIKNTFIFLTFLSCLSLIAQNGYAENKPNSPSTTSRASKKRPTALPENKPLAERFAWCAAGYATHVRIVNALNSGDTKEHEELSNWFWFNAIDLSDKPFALSIFEARTKELAAISKQADAALARGDKDLTLQLGEKLSLEINQTLEEGEQLYYKYKHVMNKVVVNADGSFSISANH